MNGIKRFCFGLIVLLLLLTGAQAAFGMWSKTANATAYGKAVSMPTGNTPTASVSVASVTVSWTQSTVSTGTPVAGYLVQRYNAATNTLQTIGSGCSGTIAALTCTETSVPTGSWKYTVMPKHHAWTGTESAKSASVMVGQLSSSSLATGHPAAASPLTTSSVSPATSIVFVWVKYSKNPTAPTVTSINGLSCTWAEIANAPSNNGSNRLSLWIGTGCSGSGALSITPSATPSSNAYAIEEFAHIDTTTPYVVSSIKTSGPAGSSSSISVTPNALASTKNAFYVGVNHTAADDVSPLNGATEISDDNRSSAEGIETNDLVGWTSGAMGGSWTSNTANPTLIGVEIRDAPAPTVSSTSPSSRGQGATSQNVTVTGTGFVSGASAAFSGAGITVNSTSFVSTTSLTANITVASNATTGARNVTVTNPDTQTGSCTNCFTVTIAPTVTSTSPSSRGQGATSQNVTVTGTGFVSGASAAFSGAGITVNSTTFVSATSLTANVTISSGAATGTRNVTVTNPDAGNGSCASCFTVNAGPTVTSTTPSSRGQGATSQNVTITGAGFVSGATASFSGTGITVNSTTFVSATSLTANVTAASNATASARTVTVTNPDVGSGSCSGCFTVNAAPTVSSTSPSSRGQGATSQNVTITGTGFVSGASAAFSGTGITVNSTTFVSATSLTANVTVSSGAATGARSVTVTNPDAGNGPCASCFTVNAGPTVTSTSPSSRGQGATSQSITITGTGFVSGATASFAASGITVNSTTFVSATSLTANVTVSSGATTGAGSVTVTNPDAGNGSCGGCFTVNAGPTVTSTSPSSRGQGAASQNVTVTGTNFVNGAAATFSGTGVTVNSTTFVSATSLTANVTVTSGAATGARNATVTNPDAGTAFCTNCFTVNAGPTVTSTSPSSRGQGAASQNVTVTGTNFVNGAAVTFSGTGVTVNSTTFVSATSLTANITVASGAATGARNVTVTNPDAGNGSCSGCFTVNAGPTITSPNSTTPAIVPNGTSLPVTIIGTGFQSGATVTISGNGFTLNSTTFVSSSQLTINVTAKNGNGFKGTYDLTVTNPDGGLVTSAGSIVNQ